MSWLRYGKRILSAVGPNAGLLTAVIPEFAALLACRRSRGSADRSGRAQLAAARRCGRSPRRNGPVLMFLDDLQWSGTIPLGFGGSDAEREAGGGPAARRAYRDGDVVAGHPLAAPLSRWRGQPTVRHLRLANLDRPGLVTIVAEMLHAGRAEAAALADAIEPRTRGNPYETVELLNALRRDGVLTPAPGGWRWQAEAVRARWTGPRTPRCKGLGSGPCRSRPAPRWRRWAALAGGRSRACCG